MFYECVCVCVYVGINLKNMMLNEKSDTYIWNMYHTILFAWNPTTDKTNQKMIEVWEKGDRKVLKAFWASGFSLQSSWA